MNAQVTGIFKIGVVDIMAGVLGQKSSFKLLAVGTLSARPSVQPYSRITNNNGISYRGRGTNQAYQQHIVSYSSLQFLRKIKYTYQQLPTKLVEQAPICKYSYVSI